MRLLPFPLSSRTLFILLCFLAFYGFTTEARKKSKKGLRCYRCSNGCYDPAGYLQYCPKYTGINATAIVVSCIRIYLQVDVATASGGISEDSNSRVTKPELRKYRSPVEVRDCAYYEATKNATDAKVYRDSKGVLLPQCVSAESDKFNCTSCIGLGCNATPPESASNVTVQNQILLFILLLLVLIFSEM